MPQRAADQNEFDCVVVEGSLRLRKEEASRIRDVEGGVSSPSRMQ